MKAKAVAVMNLAVKQEGYGRKSDMGVRAYVDAFARRECCWPHMVEEDEGADHATFGIG